MAETQQQAKKPGEVGYRYGEDEKRAKLAEYERHVTDGHTQAEAAELVNVAVATLMTWKGVMKANGAGPTSPVPKAGQGFSEDEFRKLRAENAKLRATMIDLLMGKLKIVRVGDGP